MTDHFEPWLPVAKPLANLYLQSLVLNGNALTLTVSTSFNQGNRLLQISCLNCFTYRFSQESARLRSFSINTFGASPLTRSFNSEYLNWYKKESAGTAGHYHPVHYLILCDDIVEIICDPEPLVAWMEGPL